MSKIGLFIIMTEGFTNQLDRNILNAMDNAQIDTQYIREAQRIYNGVIE